MSSYMRNKKYGKLAKELIYHKSELEYRMLVIKEIHLEFDKYQIEYCLERDIDIAKLRENHKENIKKYISSATTMGNLNKNTLIKLESKTEEEQKESKSFSYIYKEIAKKIHPDKLSQRLRTEEIEEKEKMFKKAASAFREHNWASLLEVSEALNIRPKFGSINKVCSAMSRTIDILKKKILEEEKKYGWMFANCETKECKDMLVRKLLQQFFNISA